MTLQIDRLARHASLLSKGLQLLFVGRKTSSLSVFLQAFLLRPPFDLLVFISMCWRFLLMSRAFPSTLLLPWTGTVPDTAPPSLLDFRRIRKQLLLPSLFWAERQDLSPSTTPASSYTSLLKFDGAVLCTSLYCAPTHPTLLHCPTEVNDSMASARLFLLPSGGTFHLHSELISLFLRSGPRCSPH